MGLASVLLVGGSCADGGVTPEAGHGVIRPIPAVEFGIPLTELRGVLSELNLPEAVGYTPQCALWSTGLEKERQIQLSTRARIYIMERAVWRFPQGMLL